MWPIRFTAGSYILRFTTVDGTVDLSWPPAVAFTLGRNYWVSGDGQADADGGVGGTGDLIAILDATLEAEAGATPTFTSTLTTAFQTRVVVSTGTLNLLFSHANNTVDETIFGWNVLTDSGAASTITSPNQVKGIWRPKRPIAVDSRDRQPIVGGIGRTLDGTPRSGVLTLPKKTRDLEFKYLVNAQTLIEYAATTEPFGTFEHAWNNALGLGYAFRYYPDETNLATNAYTLYTARDLKDPLKRNELHRLYWDVYLQCQRVT